MAVEILQLTDLHLMCDPHTALRGVCTRAALTEVLQYIHSGVDDGKWDFDQLVITGDLAHDEQLGTYEALRDLLGQWTPRCRLIPGNHDNRQWIRQVFPELVPADGAYLNFSVEAGGWRLIGLDSHVEGEVGGHVDGQQLVWLAEQLARYAAQPTILFVHHPPFSVRSAWLDRIGLREPATLVELIKSSRQVRAICTGHVHQQYSGLWGEIRLLTTPSTAVQFRPCQDLPVCDPIPPGFRLFRLEGDTVSTEVVRLPNLKFPPET